MYLNHMHNVQYYCIERVLCIIESRYGRYNYRPQLCNYNQTAVFSDHLVNVSLKTCKFLCTNNLLDYCSGIFWNRLTGECWRTSYTGDNVDNSANCTDPALTWMFFRRRRLSCKCFLH